MISREEFEQTLARVEALIQSAWREASTLVQGCERVLDLMPAVLTQGLRASLDEFLDLLTRLFRVLGELVGSPGWPPGLYETGDRWTNEVGKVASELAGLANADQTGVDQKWRGPAADAYKEALSAQANALKAIKATTDEIDDALLKLAIGLFALWVGIASALAIYAAELAGAGTAVWTGVGAPLGVAAAGLSTVKVIGIITGLVAGVVTFVSTVVTQYKDLNQRLTNGEGLVMGRWPGIRTTDLSDASVTDRDKTTDWQLRY